MRLGQIPEVDFCFPFFFITGPQHLDMRGGVHSIYSLDMESTAMTIKIWSHSFYPGEMDFTTFTHERWSTQNILMRDAVHSIYEGEMEFITFTLER